MRPLGGLENGAYHRGSRHRQFCVTKTGLATSATSLKKHPSGKNTDYRLRHRDRLFEVEGAINRFDILSST